MRVLESVPSKRVRLGEPTVNVLTGGLRWQLTWVVGVEHQPVILALLYLQPDATDSVVNTTSDTAQNSKKSQPGDNVEECYRFLVWASAVH
jgi:hypothetical protein